MAVLNKANVPPPALPKEVVEVPELGGEVIVRGMLLTDRIQLSKKTVNGLLSLSAFLACTVVDENLEPIYTEQQWEEFGATHFNAALNLFNKAKELSGMNFEINQKKS